MSSKEVKRKTFDQKLKYNAICAIEANKKTQAKVAAELGIAPTTVNGWIKDKEKIKRALESGAALPTCQRLRTSAYPLVDEALFEWLKCQQAARVPISGPMLCTQAIKFANTFASDYPEYSKFNASSGWLSRFNKNKGISCRSTRRRLDDDDDGVDQAWAMFQQENLAPSEATFDTCDSDMLSAEETDNDCDDDQDAPSQPVPSRAQCREHIDRLRWFLLNHQEADNRQLLDKLDAIDAFIDMQSLASLKQS